MQWTLPWPQGLFLKWLFRGGICSPTYWGIHYLDSRPDTDTGKVRQRSDLLRESWPFTNLIQSSDPVQDKQYQGLDSLLLAHHSISSTSECYRLKGVQRICACTGSMLDPHRKHWPPFETPKANGIFCTSKGLSFCRYSVNLTWL